MSVEFTALAAVFFDAKKKDFQERVECAVTGSTRKFATLRQCHRVANGELKLPSNRGQKKWKDLCVRGQFPDNALIDSAEFPHLWRMPTHVPMYAIADPSFVAVMYSAVRLCDDKWYEALPEKHQRRIDIDPRICIFVDVFRRRLTPLRVAVPLDEINELALACATYHRVESAKADAEEIGDRDLRFSMYRLHKAIVVCGLADPAEKKRQAYARACFWALFAAGAGDTSHIDTLVRRIELLYTATRRATSALRARLLDVKNNLQTRQKFFSFARHCFANFSSSAK